MAADRVKEISEKTEEERKAKRIGRQTAKREIRGSVNNISHRCCLDSFARNSEILSSFPPHAVGIIKLESRGRRESSLPVLSKGSRNCNALEGLVGLMSATTMIDEAGPPFLILAVIVFLSRAGRAS